MPKEGSKSIRKAECSVCGGIRNCKIRGTFDENGGNDDYSWRKIWYMLQCRGCENVFVQTVSSNSEEYDHYTDEQGNDDVVYREIVKYWPALSSRKMPDWFEAGGIAGNDNAELDDALNEVYGALSGDLRRLAATGIRTTFDVASERLGIDPALTFKEKLQALVSAGHIGKHDEARLEVLVEAGSASAHRGWKPNSDDLETMAGILEQFIFDAIVQPSKKTLLDEKANKMKASVPVRPARKPKAAKTVAQTKS